MTQKRGFNMTKEKRFLSVCAAACFFLCFTPAVSGSQDVAEVSIGSSGIYWQPKVSCEQICLTVSCPGGQVFRKTFEGGASPYLDLSDIKGQLRDGSYTYELQATPFAKKKTREDGGSLTKESGRDISGLKGLTQTGYFTILGGAIITPGSAVERGGEPAKIEGDPALPQDQVILDDLIVDGSVCIGFDCVNGESFGFDTLRLKENNLRIRFYDTSSSAGFPSNDWQITANDSASGGANKFSIDDIDSGKTPFTIEAGTRANALYVDDSGRVGLGTSTPSEDLHIWYGDTPTIRLDQSGGGWTPQTWDVAGNEANFFIRDVTNGSRLPFRIQPGTPSSTLCLKADGKVGIGTWSPLGNLEVETTGANSVIMFERTDGATGKFTARPSEIYIGTSSDHNVVVVANNNAIMTLEPGGDVGIGTTDPGYKLEIVGGAYCDGGAWVPGSSREYKENIAALTLSEAEEALDQLDPVKFNYKTNKDEDYIGFIAEDVPELVATRERRGVAPMDVIAVLTKVVQDQQKELREQKTLALKQQETISELRDRISRLEKK